MSEPRYERLQTPGRIGTMAVKNRLVMPAMGTGYANEEGFVSPSLKKYHHERALGGVGLIVTEVTAVVYSANNLLTIADDKYIPGLAELAQTIHAGGAKAALQLWHGGPQRASFDAELELVGPSPVPGADRKIPRELTIDDIQGLIDSFAAGAVRAQKAGFDGVEIHGAHGYLIAQFLSGRHNQRQDEYGGSLEKRARLLLDIIRAIRKSVGPEFPVWCRVNGEEFGIRGGNSIADTKEVAKWAAAGGADAIHVSAWGSVGYGSATVTIVPGILAPLAAQIKEVVDVPVIAVGRLDHDLGEAILRDGQADFVSIGRRLIADPAYHQKVFTGRSEDVNPCIGCNECIDFVGGSALRCAVNPAVGTEDENRILPAMKARKVVVVGGGPAGLKAATTAALRGHSVTLIENSPRLGGQLNLAAIPPGKEEIGKLISYLGSQAAKAGVRIELNTPVSTDYLRKLKPDVAVFATGVVPLAVNLPGLTGPKVVSAADMLEEKVPVGDDVVVIGGGLIGCETAHFLASQGKNVTIVEMLGRVAVKMGETARWRLLNKLGAHKVRILTDACCEELQGNELTVTLKKDEKQKIVADTFVLATGNRAEASMYKEAVDLVPEVHLIGDASEPRTIGDAMRDGLRVGLTI